MKSAAPFFLYQDSNFHVCFIPIALIQVYLQPLFHHLKGCQQNNLKLEPLMQYFHRINTSHACNINVTSGITPTIKWNQTDTSLWNKATSTELQTEYTKNKLTRTSSASDRKKNYYSFYNFHKPLETLKITKKEKQENVFAYVAERKLNSSESLRFRNASIKLPPRANLILVATKSSFSTGIWNRKFSSCDLSHKKEHYTLQGPSDAQSGSKP